MVAHYSFRIWRHTNVYITEPKDDRVIITLTLTSVHLFSLFENRKHKKVINIWLQLSSHYLFFLL